MMVEKDLEACLMLNRISSASAARMAEWVGHFGSVSAVFQASMGELKSVGLSDAAIQAIRNPDYSGVEADLRWLSEGKDRGLLIHGQKGYPALLGEIHTAPWILFYQGKHQILDDPQLAMIGTRTPTAGGAETAFDFAQAFSQMGLVITSGLAQGIDTEAHRGVLSANGSTIAVVGSGPDRVYPAKNRDLAHQIVEKGVIISEFPVGTPPRRGNFPRRNRLLSGLSLGVLVVEAAKQSGTMITARYALEQGREVFAIPGSIHNPLSKGCHALIKNGAKLVESAEDVLHEIAPQLAAFLNQEKKERTRRKRAKKEAPLDLFSTRKKGAEEEQILQAMGYDPCSVDLLQARTKLPAEKLCSTLVMLEIDGAVEALSDGRWQRL